MFFVMLRIILSSNKEKAHNNQIRFVVYVFRGPPLCSCVILIILKSCRTYGYKFAEADVGWMRFRKVDYLYKYSYNLNILRERTKHSF
jgi:hypothetical protein